MVSANFRRDESDGECNKVVFKDIRDVFEDVDKKVVEGIDKEVVEGIAKEVVEGIDETVDGKIIGDIDKVAKTVKNIVVNCLMYLTVLATSLSISPIIFPSVH